MSEIGSNSNKDFQEAKKMIADMAKNVAKITKNEAEKGLKSTSVDLSGINVDSSGLEEKVVGEVVDSVKKGAKKAQSKIKDIKITPNLQFEVDDIDFAKIKNKLDGIIKKSLNGNATKADNTKFLDLMATADKYGGSFGGKYQDYRKSIIGQFMNYSPKDLAKDFVSASKVIEAQNRMWEEATEHLNRYIALSKEAAQANRNILPRGDDPASPLVNPNDTTKKSNYVNVTQKSLKDKLSDYLNDSSDIKFDTLAAYTNALGNMTKAEEIFGKRHADLFKRVKEYIDQARKSSDAFVGSSRSFMTALNDIGIKNVDPEKLAKFKDVLSKEGLESGLEYLKTELGVEIPQAMKQAFNEDPIVSWVNQLEKAEQASEETKQKINEAISISKRQDAGSAVQTLEEELEKASQISAENATKQNERAEQSYKELTKVAKEYYNLREREARGVINGTDLDYLNELREKWERATQGVKEYQIATGGTPASTNKVQNAKNLFDAATAKAARDFAESLSEMQEKLVKLGGSEKYTQNLKDDLMDLAKQIQKINSEPIDLNAEGAIKSIANLREEYDKLVDRTKSADFKIANEESIAKLNSQIDEFVSKNSKMGQGYRERFNSLKLDFDNEESLSRLKEIVSEFNKLKGEIYQANLTGKGFFDNLGNRIKQMSTNFIAMYFSLYDIVRYAKTAVNTIQDLDYALVDLKKTTTMSNADLNEFYYNSNDVAKQMGTSTKDIINQAAAWSRLGYSSKDAATEMAALSSKFAAISPGMTLDQSTDGLVSTMKAFHIEVDDTERDIMDNVNRIGRCMPKRMVTYGVAYAA